MTLGIARSSSHHYHLFPGNVHPELKLLHSQNVSFDLAELVLSIEFNFASPFSCYSTRHVSRKETRLILVVRKFKQLMQRNMFFSSPSKKGKRQYNRGEGVSNFAGVETHTPSRHMSDCIPEHSRQYLLKLSNSRPVEILALKEKYRFSSS